MQDVCDRSPLRTVGPQVGSTVQALLENEGLDRVKVTLTPADKIDEHGGSSPDDDFPILPSTKVGALLDRYPELEGILISLAPVFKKLRNPLLRKGVAKVASLKHAAAVGGVPVNDLVNKLRAAVGQEAIVSEDASESISYFSGQPEWFAVAKIVTSIDERAADPNKMPIVAVLQTAARLHAGEILELVTTFLPAPGIEIMKSKGLRVWSVQQGPELIRTYVSKPCD